MTHAVTGRGALTAKVKLPDRERLRLRLPGGHRPTARPGRRSQTNRSTDDEPQRRRTTGYGITGTTGGAWVDLTATRAGRHDRGAVPLLDRPFANRAGLPGRQHHPGRPGHRHRRDRRRGLDLQRLPATRTADRRQATSSTFNAYIAENRQYDGYDASLKTAYNFGFLGTAKDNWVETHPYMHGPAHHVLGHPVRGQQRRRPPRARPGPARRRPPAVQPLAGRHADAQPDPVLRLDVRPRADGGADPAPEQVRRAGQVRGDHDGHRPVPPGRQHVRRPQHLLVRHGRPHHRANGTHPGRYQPGWYSVDVPKTGTTITVVSQAKQGNQLNLQVN